MNLTRSLHLKAGLGIVSKLHIRTYILELERIWQIDLSTVAADLENYLHLRNNFVDRDGNLNLDRIN
jgi:hypothetical protein